MNSNNASALADIFWIIRGKLSNQYLFDIARADYMKHQTTKDVTRLNDFLFCFVVFFFYLRSKHRRHVNTLPIHCIFGLGNSSRFVARINFVTRRHGETCRWNEQNGIQVNTIPLKHLSKKFWLVQDIVENSSYHLF